MVQEYSIDPALPDEERSDILDSDLYEDEFDRDLDEDWDEDIIEPLDK